MLGMCFGDFFYHLSMKKQKSPQMRRSKRMLWHCSIHSIKEAKEVIFTLISQKKVERVERD